MSLPTPACQAVVDQRARVPEPDHRETMRSCPDGTVALVEGRAWSMAPVGCSDGEREFGEGCWESVVWGEIDGQLIVSAAQVLDKRRSGTDHSR